MNEDERRELIARQHRALYGEGSNLYTGDPATSRPLSQDARVSTAIGGGRKQSPLAFDPFGMQTSGAGDNSAVQMPSRDQGPKDGAPGGNRSRANSNSSPASNPTTSFGLFDNAQQSSRTSNSSPTSGSPPRQGSKPTSASSGVGPIGSRPVGSQAPGGAGQPLSKRSTTPLPSPLSYGFSASEQQGGNANERTNSAASNPNSGVADKGVGLGWGSNSGGVWGNSSNKLGVQASVWG